MRLVGVREEEEDLEVRLLSLEDILDDSGCGR